MSVDILESLNSTLGGPLIRQAGTYFGETEKNTHSALRSIGPALLAGLMQWAATPAGVTQVFENVTDEGIDPNIAAKLPGLFSNRGSIDALVTSGEAVADKVFGNRMGSVTNAVSQVSGVMPDSALALVSMAAPLLFGVIRKYVTQNDLNAADLGALLQKQRRSLAHSRIDDRVASALGFGDKTQLLSALPDDTPHTPAAKPAVSLKKGHGRAWMPWAIAAGVAILGMLLFVNRTAERRDTETASSSAASDRMRLAVAPTTVYFEAGEIVIGPEDRQRIAGAAASAKNQDRAVAITGYTDRSGDEAKNYELAKDRAYAVRDALVDAGIAEERIVVGPPRFTADSGEQEAHRVDIDVR